MKGTGQRISRSRNLRGGSNSEQSVDSTLRSSASVFRMLFHICFCIASLVLGFRLSRESLLVVVNLTSSDGYLQRPSSLPSLPFRTSGLDERTENKSLVQDPLVALSKVKPSGLYHEDGVKSSRVHVGRHGILVRPWPHPDPVETMLAHSLIARVQQEQRKLYGLIERRPVIVITPTYRRTFQALHLSSLMHTLRLVPGPLSWIVIEAGGGSKETAAVLSKSGLNYKHLSLPDPMPVTWAERYQMETRLRIRGLRFVRDNELEGIVVFADESNSHKLELFDEVQKVQWVGAVSMGLLVPSQGSDDGKDLLRWNSMNVADPTLGFLPIQGPACNVSGNLIGWHSESGSVSVIKGASKRWPKFEWAGFVLNSAAVLDGPGRPKWIRDFDEWAPPTRLPASPTAIVTDDSYIEPLGDCGREVLLWFARIEARADSKYPDGWVTKHQLEVVVPAKHTPWPDPSPPPPPIQSDPPPPDPRQDVEDEGIAQKKRQGKQPRHRRTKKKSSKEEH